MTTIDEAKRLARSILELADRDQAFCLVMLTDPDGEFMLSTDNFDHGLVQSLGLLISHICSLAGQDRETAIKMAYLIQDGINYKFDEQDKVPIS